MLKFQEEIRVLRGERVLKVKNEDLLILKRILGDIYIENGNVKEVVLLSQAIDIIITSIQKRNCKKC